VEAGGGRLISEALDGLREAIIGYYARREEIKLGIDPDNLAQMPEALGRYQDFQIWNTLPWPGGTEQQPWLLLLEIGVCMEEELRRMEREQAAAQSSSGLSKGV